MLSIKPPEAISASQLCRVLIVDDNPLNVLLVKTLLSQQGYALAEAGDAQQALAAVASMQPHLILMDLELPGLDGLTLARKLKAHPATCGIRIVAFTAHTAADTEGAVRAAGCDGLLTKPIEPATFREAVQGYLAGAECQPGSVPG